MGVTVADAFQTMQAFFGSQIAGQFSQAGFDAIVHLDVQQPGSPSSCAYDVHWVGTKTGDPNVLPSVGPRGSIERRVVVEPLHHLAERQLVLGANPRRIVFSVMVRGTMNCRR